MHIGYVVRDKSNTSFVPLELACLQDRARWHRICVATTTTQSDVNGHKAIDGRVLDPIQAWGSCVHIVTTPLSRALRPEAIAEGRRQVPLGRLSYPSEQTEMAVCLASPVASFIELLHRAAGLRCRWRFFAGSLSTVGGHV
jgi:hypothetical protein